MNPRQPTQFFDNMLVLFDDIREITGNTHGGVALRYDTIRYDSSIRLYVVMCLISISHIA